MESAGASLGLVRLIGGAGAERLPDLLFPGRVLEADVLSVFQGRAVLAFGRGIRMEAALQVPLLEGDRVRVQVLPPDSGSSGMILLKYLGSQASRDGIGLADKGEAQPGGISKGQPDSAQPVWLAIPLPDGRQGWVQLYRPQEPPAGSHTADDLTVHAVRLYWESPELGTVQVNLDTAGTHLSTLFTASRSESRVSIERNFPVLAQGLEQVGFSGARLGCRAPDPGKILGPVRPESPSRVDRRI